MTDYDRSLVPNQMVAALDVGQEEKDDWISTSGLSIGYPAWGWIYHTALMLLDPSVDNTVVETGTNLGSTSIMLAQAIVDSKRRGHLHTIEIDPERRATAQKRFVEAGVSEVVTSHLGDSLTTLETLMPKLGQIAFAFLDGNHFHDHVLREFELVEPFLRPDGVVLFDNTYMIAEGNEDPRVNGGLRTIQERFGGNILNLPFCSWYTPGLAIWQRQPFEDMTPPAPGSFVPNT